MNDKEKKEFRWVKSFFSDEEKREFGFELARINEAIAALESEKKSFNDNIKAKVTTKDADASRISRYLIDGYKQAQMECIVRIDAMHNRKQFLHPETLELVDETVLEDADRQIELI